jgi:membrane protein DedA with SNARE-associated domain
VEVRPVPERELVYELISWFAFLMSAAFGNPIPEEVMIISGGIRTSQLGEHGAWRWLMLPACMLGALVADVLLYGLGRAFGELLSRKVWLARLAPPEKQQHIRDNFNRYGAVIFIIGRLVPGIRTTLFLTAGTMRLPLVRFCIADGIGALFGTTLFFFLGYALGAQFQDLIERIEKRIDPYKPILLIALLLAVVAYLVYSFWKRPTPTGDPEEVPIIGHQIATHLPAVTGVKGDEHTEGGKGEATATGPAPTTNTRSSG